MKVAILWLLIAVMFFRLSSLILGCFYGPYIYIVLPLGGIYLAFDALTFYMIQTGASDDEPPNPTEKGFKMAWTAFNVVGVIGLLVAFGLFLNLGFWSMSHNPIHLVLFIFITCLIITIFLTMGLNFTSLRRKHRPYRGLST